jgi:hypothetical protein
MQAAPVGRTPKDLMQMIDAHTGRGLFEQSALHVYRIHATETINTALWSVPGGLFRPHRAIL